MSDDDFMQDSDVDEETYDFEYEDDEDEGDTDIDIENKYYNAKALKDDQPAAAIEALKGVLEQEGDQKGDWGFKALKQICKISFNILDDKETALKYYKILLTYTKSAVTRNYSEKSLNNILDYVSNSTDSTFMESFYETTLSNLAEAKNDRLWLKTNLKLAKLWLDRKEYSRLTKILRELHAACETKEGEEDQTKGSHLLEVYALEIQMYTETKNNKKLKELYTRTLRVKSSITHPRIMGVIRECGGKMHMYVKDWENAQTDFFESFRNYDEAGSPQRITVLKYLVLSNMLNKSSINPFDSQETKPYRNDPQITSMTSLVEAYQRDDIAAFEKILRENRADIMDDKFIAQYIQAILTNIRTAVLIRLIAPYSRVQLSFIADELAISNDEVEELLVELILDDKVFGQIDSVQGILDLDMEKIRRARQAGEEAVKPSRGEVMEQLVTEVDQLWKHTTQRVAAM